MLENDRWSAQVAHFMLEKTYSANSGHWFALKDNITVANVSHGYMYV